MNVLFLTLSKIRNDKQNDIYSALLKEFVKNGDNVYVVSPCERRESEKIKECTFGNLHLYFANIGNYYNTKWIEKGITTLFIGRQYKKLVRKDFSNVRFDLILYSTPPITFSSLIKYLKKKSGAVTYLMLKDIWPQSMVDMETLGTKGLQGVIYNYFKLKERKLYIASDYIGCMSPACRKYLLNNDKYIDPNTVELCPNAVNFESENVLRITDEKKDVIRVKYGIPNDKVVFIFGGNIGNGHDPDFLEACIKLNEKRTNTFILFVGRGFFYERIKKVISGEKIKNSNIIAYLPQDKYQELMAACDVGMITLDHRFTCPNYPSRLMSYLLDSKPVIIAQDRVSDVGPIAEENGYGFWCESTDASRFVELMDRYIDPNVRKKMGERGYNFLKENYNTKEVYKTICKHIEKG